MNRWDFDKPIPKSVRLFGVRVAVRVLVGEDRKRLNGCDSVWVYSHQDGVAAILIDGELPLEVQRYCLAHEQEHAAIEVVDIALEKCPHLVQTKWMSTQGRAPVQEPDDGVQFSSQSAGDPVDHVNGHSPRDTDGRNDAGPLG